MLVCDFLLASQTNDLSRINEVAINVDEALTNGNNIESGQRSA